jgi:hypothetical protein
VTRRRYRSTALKYDDVTYGNQTIAARASLDSVPTIELSLHVQQLICTHLWPLIAYTACPKPPNTTSGVIINHTIFVLCFAAEPPRLFRILPISVEYSSKKIVDTRTINSRTFHLTESDHTMSFTIFRYMSGLRLGPRRL